MQVKEKSKEQLTVILGTNMDGSVKLMPVLNTIFYFDQSWNMVLQKTVENCLGHTGFNSVLETKVLLHDPYEDTRDFLFGATYMVTFS